MDASWDEYDVQEVAWAYTARDESFQPILYKNNISKEFVEKWLGMTVSDEELHYLCGAPPGARISISAIREYIAISSVGQANVVNRDGQEVIAKYKPLVYGPLSVKAGGTGEQVLQFHYCTSEPQRTGFGTDAIARMVPICEKLTLVGIYGLLAGDGHDQTEISTGYYVWPGQGFDALLADWEDLHERPLLEELQTLPDGNPIQSLQDLFAVDGGRAWWFANGSTIEGTFEIQSGSISRRQLRNAVEKLAQERRRT